jgi:DNA-binding transcriptional LysR family regulator
MTIEQIKAFLAVVEHGSFRKAAKAIFKTQAAVSASIKSLEDEYTIQLFDRTEYRPKLTVAGQAFIDDARLAMSHFDRLDKVGQQLTKGVESQFNIVVSLAFPLPRLLNETKIIVDKFPLTQFKVFTEALNGVVERIDTEEADIAFGPDLGLNTTHEKFAISSVTFINVAAPNYFNCAKDEEISLDEVSRYSQIIIRDSAIKAEKASYYTTSNSESWSVNDFNIKKELLLAKLGWGRMPEHLISAEMASGELVAVNVEGIPTKMAGPVYMFRRRNSARGPIARQFWDELISAYEISN